MIKDFRNLRVVDGMHFAEVTQTYGLLNRRRTLTIFRHRAWHYWRDLSDGKFMGSDVIQMESAYLARQKLEGANV